MTICVGDSKCWMAFLSVAIILGSSAPVAATEPRNLAPPQILAQLDALLEKSTSPTLPGCALGIQGKGIDVTRAYGLADLERPVPNTVDSVFNIASASKQFTAAAVLLLAGEGKLALDDDIREHLPELSPIPHKITIDHLLTHTSGLRDYRFTDWMLGRDTQAQSNRDILAYAARQKALNHAPGESHLYSNTGYILLAIIVERVSDLSLQEFSRERLFEPAGMKDTHWEMDSQRVVTKRSSGYALAWPPEGEGKPIRFEHLPTARNTYGAGNLLSTVGDMQRWNAALSRNAFGRKVTAQLEERARLRNGFEIEYARGEIVGEYRGLRELQHGGYNGNYTAWIGRYPQIGLSVSMLCNSDHEAIDLADVIDLFLPMGTPPREAGSDIAGPTTDLSMHNGVYRLADDAQLALLTFPDKAQVKGSSYVLGPYTYDFDAKRPGRISRRTYGNEAQWVRLPEWKPAPTDLSQYQGRYTSDELLGSFSVRLDGKNLVLTVLGLSDINSSLQPQALDVFKAQGGLNLDGLLVEFKRDDKGRISGLAVAPDSLHDLPFRKVD